MMIGILYYDVIEIDLFDCTAAVHVITNDQVIPDSRVSEAIVLCGVITVCR